MSERFRLFERLELGDVRVEDCDVEVRVRLEDGERHVIRFAFDDPWHARQQAAILDAWRDTGVRPSYVKRGASGALVDGEALWRRALGDEPVR